MRLFLSSYRFGDFADELLELVGEDADVAVIANARDYNTLKERGEGVHALFDDFKDFGITAHEIDLRDYFADNTGLREKLAQHGFVWLAGGNTFLLRKALKYSGADKILQELVRGGEVVYGGESAGAILATPTLQGVEFADDPYIVPAGYKDEDIWDGLGLVPYAIVPHYGSPFEGLDRMIEVLEDQNIPYKTLNDSEVIIVSDEGE